MTRVDAVLFDWGDTLFESPHAPSVILDAARDRGIPMAPAAARRVWDELWEAGKSAEEHAKGRDLSREAHRRVWLDLFARANATVPGIDRVLYDRVMDPAGWLPYPDARPTLETLRERGVRTGIVSNHVYDPGSCFAANDLDRFIDGYTLSYEVGAPKPSPLIFAAACHRLGVAAPSALMVGDDAVSDGGAVAAGLQVYILSAHPHPPATARGLAHVVELVDRSRA